MDNDTSPSQPSTSNPTGASSFSLRRSSTDQLLGGVCAGIAEHFELDVDLVRLGTAALSICGGVGLVLYLAAWLLVPEKGASASLADALIERLGLQ